VHRQLSLGDRLACFSLKEFKNLADGRAVQISEDRRDQCSAQSKTQLEDDTDEELIETFPRMLFKPQ
jgi:hypothetical protein